MSSAQDTAGYIRVRHLGLNNSSIYLADLDREVNRERGDRNKVPVYVPVGGIIDILITERTLASFHQGDIHGFTEGGYIESYIVRELSPASSFEEIFYNGSGEPIQTIMWTDDNRTSKVEERLITHSAGKVTEEVKIAYDEDGNETSRSTFTFTYSGDNVVEIREELS